jgi:hypothetical protein
MQLKRNHHVVDFRPTPASFQCTSQTVAGFSRYGSYPSLDKIVRASVVGVYPPSLSFIKPQARDQCRIEVTMLRPTPKRAIDSSSEKMDLGAEGVDFSMLSKALRSHSCLSGNVSCPENCSDGVAKVWGTPKSTGELPQSQDGPWRQSPVLPLRP